MVFGQHPATVLFLVFITSVLDVSVGAPFRLGFRLLVRLESALSDLILLLLHEHLLQFAVTLILILLHPALKLHNILRSVFRRNYHHFLQTKLRVIPSKRFFSSAVHQNSSVSVEDVTSDV